MTLSEDVFPALRTRREGANVAYLFPQLFSALGEGGTVIMPMGDTFWGAYFGICVDRFGINWMISFENPQSA